MKLTPTVHPPNGPVMARLILFRWCALAALILLPLAAAAQPAHLKWGDVPLDELDMQTYPVDTNAAAVVLADYVEVDVSDRGEVRADYFRRVKILTEEGYSWGNPSHTFYVGEDGDAQKVGRVRGQTFVLRDGRVERHPMERDAVFEEEVSADTRRVRFSLPRLEPGAVIEYRYRLTSDNPHHVPDWHFQWSEPVHWSGYQLTTTGRFAYVTASNVVEFDEHETVELNRPGGDLLQTRWVRRHLPAIRTEPYMTTPEDYREALLATWARRHEVGDAIERVAAAGRAAAAVTVMWRWVASRAWTKFGAEALT